MRAATLDVSLLRMSLLARILLLVGDKALADLVNGSNCRVHRFELLFVGVALTTLPLQLRLLVSCRCIVGFVKVISHSAWNLASLMVLKSFLELKLDFLEVRDEDFLMGHDHTFLLLLSEAVLVYRLPELLLLFEPAIAASFNPLVKVVLRLGIRLHEDIIVVKL